MSAELVATATASDADRLLQAEAVVRRWCGWHIAPVRTEVLTLDPNGAYLMVLPTLQITSVTSVLVDDVALTVDTDYAWSAAGYLVRTYSTVDSESSPYWPTCGWGTKPRSVKVSLSHGYAVTPPDVASVVQSMASRAEANPMGLVQETVGPFSQTYASGADVPAALGLTVGEMAALAPYRLPPRP